MYGVTKKIETEYPVAQVTVNGEQVWPYLRVRYAFYGENEKFIANGERAHYNPDPFINRWQTIKTSLYGLRHWLRRYKYIALAPSIDRRLINGEQYSRFLDPIIDELGQENVLFIEQPSPIHYDNPHTKHIVSEALLFEIWYMVMRVMRKNPVIDNVDILQAIQKRLGLCINDYQRVKEFNTLRTIFKILFRWMRPKALLISDYYGFTQAAVKAAHDLGIKVVEAQHGTISTAHPAYSVNTDLDRSFFADYLLMFGKKEMYMFADGRFIDPTHVYPVGSFYLDHIRTTFTSDSATVKGLASFDKSVAVGLQLGFEKAMVDFVNRAAILDPKIGYFLMPRIADHYFDSVHLERNVVLYTEHNMFEVLPHFDFHATVSSTTAVEAPSLGVRDIIVDIDGDGRKHLWSQVPESEIARYVTTPQEMVDAIRTYPAMTRERVCELNEENIEPNYRDNIKRFVKGVL